MQQHVLNFTQSPVHWVLCVSVGEYYDERLLAYLSIEEKQRCQSLYQQADRQRYVVAHALKRHVLSLLLECSLSSLSFNKTETGRPYCEHSSAPDFNLSHSDDYVVFACSSLSTVGVDVEPVSRTIADGVARQILDTANYERWQREADTFVLLTHWTQKEAISKAVGLGLSMGFKTITSSGHLRPGQFCYQDRTLHYNTTQYNHVLLSVATFHPKALSVYKVTDWTDEQITPHFVQVL